MEYKKPKYLTIDDFSTLYPNLDTSLYRSDLLFLDPSIQTEEIILQEIQYKNEQDAIFKKIYGDTRPKSLQLSEVLEQGEIIRFTDH